MHETSWNERQRAFITHWALSLYRRERRKPLSQGLLSQCPSLLLFERTLVSLSAIQLSTIMRTLNGFLQNLLSHANGACVESFCTLLECFNECVDFTSGITHWSERIDTGGFLAWPSSACCSIRGLSLIREQRWCAKLCPLPKPCPISSDSYRSVSLLPCFMGDIRPKHWSSKYGWSR